MSDEFPFVVHRVTGGCACFCGPDSCGVCHNCGADLGWREKDRSPEANRNREAERAAIVKWLRTSEGDGWTRDSDRLADAIERGEHLK